MTSFHMRANISVIYPINDFLDSARGMSLNTRIPVIGNHKNIEPPEGLFYETKLLRKILQQYTRVIRSSGDDKKYKRSYQVMLLQEIFKLQTENKFKIL